MSAKMNDHQSNIPIGPSAAEITVNALRLLRAQFLALLTPRFE
ncbi:hypothetical protein [Bradyrhizobium sp. DASA03120]